MSRDGACRSLRSPKAQRAGVGRPKLGRNRPQSSDWTTVVATRTLRGGRAGLGFAGLELGSAMAHSAGGPFLRRNPRSARRIPAKCWATPPRASAHLSDDLLGISNELALQMHPTVFLWLEEFSNRPGELCSARTRPDRLRVVSLTSEYLRVRTKLWGPAPPACIGPTTSIRRRLLDIVGGTDQGWLGRCGWRRADRGRRVADGRQVDCEWGAGWRGDACGVCR